MRKYELILKIYDDEVLIINVLRGIGAMLREIRIHREKKKAGKRYRLSSGIFGIGSERESFCLMSDCRFDKGIEGNLFSVRMSIKHHGL